MAFSSLAFGVSGLSPQKMNKNMGHSEINFLPWKLNQFVGRPISGEIPHFRNSLCFLVVTFRMMHSFYDIVFILTSQIIKESMDICVWHLHIKYLWPNKIAFCSIINTSQIVDLKLKKSSRDLPCESVWHSSFCRFTWYCSFKLNISYTLQN